MCLTGHGADDKGLLPSDSELIVVLMLVNGVSRADSLVEPRGPLPARQAGRTFMTSHPGTASVVTPVVAFKKDGVLSR